jgi:hypothetical protein
VEVIEETIKASTIGCTKWVINLEEPTLENIGLDTIDFGNVLIDLGSLYITEVDRVQNPRMFLKPP